MTTTRDLLDAAREEIRPALPILTQMADEHARRVLSALLTPDTRADAILELRRNATPEQWQAFSQATVQAGQGAATKAVTDRNFLMGLLADVLLGAAGSLFK